VRGIGNESLSLLKRILEPTKKIVDRSSETAEFVSRIRDVEA
jgi:hypothetical protein